MVMHATWGTVYGPTDVKIREGGVTVIDGVGGRGRASLMLTLAGRMRLFGWHLECVRTRQ